MIVLDYFPPVYFEQTAAIVEEGKKFHLSELPSQLQPLKPLLDDLCALAKKHHNNPHQKIPVAAIGGCPGIGKTHLSKLLLEELQRQNISCAIVHFDDWTRPPETRKVGKANDYFNLEGVHQFFQALSSGSRFIAKPVIDETTDQHGVEYLNLNDVDLILFEGLICLSSEVDTNYISY